MRNEYAFGLGKPWLLCETCTTVLLTILRNWRQLRSWANKFLSKPQGTQANHSLFQGHKEQARTSLSLVHWKTIFPINSLCDSNVSPFSRKGNAWRRKKRRKMKEKEVIYIYKFLLRFYLSSSVRSGPHYYLGSSTLSLTQWTCAVCGVLWSLLVLFNSLHSFFLQCCS